MGKQEDMKSGLYGILDEMERWKLSRQCNQNFMMQNYLIIQRMRYCPRVMDYLSKTNISLKQIPHPGKKSDRYVFDHVVGNIREWVKELKKHEFTKKQNLEDSYETIDDKEDR